SFFGIRIPTGTFLTILIVVSAAAEANHAGSKLPSPEELSRLQVSASTAKNEDPGNLLANHLMDDLDIRWDRANPIRAIMLSDKVFGGSQSGTAIAALIPTIMEKDENARRALVARMEKLKAIDEGSTKKQKDILKNYKLLTQIIA